VAARRVAALRVVLVSYPLSVLVVAALAPVVGGVPDVASLLWGGAAGVVAGLAVWWFYLALAAGPMSVVSPLTAVLVAGLPLLVGVGLGERPSALALLGAVLALAAVVLVSRDSGHSELRFTGRVAALTLGSGVAFAGYFILLAQITVGTGLWPLLASRVGAAVVVVLAALVVRQHQAPQGVPLRLAGLLDVVANVAFLYAVQGGLLSLVSVITALYPAATVLLATVVLGERTARVQQVGMVLAAASVALIASQS